MTAIELKVHLRSWLLLDGFNQNETVLEVTNKSMRNTQHKQLKCSISTFNYLVGQVMRIHKGIKVTYAHKNMVTLLFIKSAKKNLKQKEMMTEDSDTKTNRATPERH